MVSDTILNKPGRLTDEEFEQMKKHTTAGAEVISRAMDMVSEENSGYLKEARNLAQFHHEKWNGTGYPCGLKGEDIPLSARIMAVADVFDALVSKRSYKESRPAKASAAARMHPCVIVKSRARHIGLRRPRVLLVEPIIDSTERKCLCLACLPR